MGYPAIAQHYWEAGWQGVIPLPPMRKVPPPKGYTGRGNPMPTEEQIFKWIESERPNSNVGLRLPDGVIGIDIDAGYKGKEGDSSLQKLIDRCGALPDTWASTSRLSGEGVGSGIRFFKVPLDKFWRERETGNNIELITHTHRFAVVWPSKHPDTGQTYRWIKPDGTVAENEFPSVDDLATLPEKWVAALTTTKTTKSAWEYPPATNKTLDEYFARVDKLALGLVDGRNNELNIVSWHLGQLIPGGLVDEKSVRDKLYNAAAQCGLIAEDGEAKVLATIESGLKRGMEDPRRVYAAPDRRECTDIGNAYRFADREAGKIVYVAAWDKWMRWDGTCWVSDSAAIRRAAQDTAMSIASEFNSATTDSERGEIFKWYKTSQQSRNIDSMLKEAKPLRPISREPSDFDTEKNLFNCANGIIDLKTGTFVDHNSEMMMSRISPIEYDANAQCPQFMQFMKRIFGGDLSLINFMQQIVGYSLTGEVSENRMFVLWGNGANGKSTFIDIILGLCGQYGNVADPNMLLSSMQDRHTAELAVLNGARMVSCNETDANRSFAEARVKAITGGDIINARYMGGNPFTYKPQFKLWLASNYRPRVRNDDAGMWRRLTLIPFNVQIPECERERDLSSKLLDAEGPGILAWAVAGAVDWYENRLTLPNAVTLATEGYRKEEDTFEHYIEAQFVRDPNATVASSEARMAYNDWAMENGERKPNSQEFKRLMETHGYVLKKTKNANVFVGIRRRNPTDMF